MQNSTFKPKKRKCRICKTPYLPFRPLQAVCLSIECSVQYGRQIAAKKERIEAKKERQGIALRREALRSNNDEAALTQIVINRYVNIRDAGKPCISCGKPDIGVRNASHYKSRGSNSALRFNLWNINSSCYRCNKELSGNIEGYRPGLIERIGIDKFNFLQNHPRSREYTKEYLRRMRVIFSRKTKRLLKSRENTSPP